MGKNQKKPVKKVVTKPAKPAKFAVKPVKPGKPLSAKSNKPSKPLMKTLVKAVRKVIGKSAPSKPELKVAHPAKTQSAKTGKSTPPEPLKLKTHPAPKKETKKSKKAKKNKDQDIDLGDDLVGDDDMGAEEIPDLTEFEELEVEEIEELEVEESETEAAAASSKPSGDEEVILTDAEGRRYCRVRDCDQISVVEGYCRFHYLLLWKRIQVRRKILTDGKLQRYVEELTARYPDKFLEMIRKDLRTEKDFLASIAELEIDESAIDNEFEDEAQNFIDEVRGMTEGSGMSDDQDDF